MEARPTAESILDGLGAHHTLTTLETERAAAEPWEPPAPVGGTPAVPPFPVQALPGWVAEQVAAVATETQTPPDLAGCVALAALSTAAGGRAVVEVRGAWREPVNLFTVVALPPGSRKSPVFNALARPLLQAEAQLAEAAHARIVEAELARRVAQRAAEKAANNAAVAGTPEALAEASGALCGLTWRDLRSIEVGDKIRLARRRSCDDAPAG